MISKLILAGVFDNRLFNVEKLFQKAFSKEKPHQKKISRKVQAFLLLTEPLKVSISIMIAPIEETKNLIDTNAVMSLLTRVQVGARRTVARTLLVLARHLLQVVLSRSPPVNVERLLIFNIE